jgi:hypothetical protein
MSAQGPFSSAHPFSSGFLKAWVDQAGAFQDMFARLADQSTAAMPASMLAPHLAPWKDFVEKMGMGGFDPQTLPGMPALGLSREYQAPRCGAAGSQLTRRAIRCVDRLR